MPGWLTALFSNPKPPLPPPPPQRIYPLSVMYDEVIWMKGALGEAYKSPYVMTATAVVVTTYALMLLAGYDVPGGAVVRRRRHAATLKGLNNIICGRGYAVDIADPQGKKLRAPDWLEVVTNGVMLRSRMWGDLNGIPVVVTAGGNAGGESCEDLCRAIAVIPGVQCLQWDRRNTGLSSYSVDEWRDCSEPLAVAHDLMALASAHALRRPLILIGSGTACAIAVTYASRYPLEVRAMVLMNPIGGASQVSILANQLYLRHKKAVEARGMKVLFQGADALPYPGVAQSADVRAKMMALTEREEFCGAMEKWATDVECTGTGDYPMAWCHESELKGIGKESKMDVLIVAPAPDDGLHTKACARYLHERMPGCKLAAGDSWWPTTRELIAAVAGEKEPINGPELMPQRTPERLPICHNPSVGAPPKNAWERAGRTATMPSAMEIRLMESE